MHEKSIRHAIPVLLLVMFGVSPWATAAPLKSAVVTEVKNEVELKKEAAAQRAAVKNDTVKDKDVLSTGKKSRAELEFPDKSIARLGSNTVFSFDPKSREMRLGRGTALIHVPPGLDSTTTISTPAATAAVIGDVIEMGVTANGTTQIIALSQDDRGPVKVTLNKTGEVRTLKAGEMLVIDPLMMKIPEPVAISVDAIAQSSGLIGGFEKPLPKTATAEINQTQQVQATQVASGQLEGGHKLKINTEAPKVRTETETVAVQSTAGSGLAGRYVGSSVEVIGSTPGSVSPLILDIKADGSMTTFSGNDIGTGFVSANGNFNVHTSKGNTITGSASFGNGTISGNYSQPNNTPPPPTESGTFSVSK